MASLTLYGTILVASLGVCLVKSADIVARVPSSYRKGTKWVLFRDDSVPDPPTNVVQADNDVQVLPTYRYQQQQHRLQGYRAVSMVPLYAEAASVHFRATDVSGDFNKDVVESIPADLLLQQPQYDFDIGQGRTRQQEYMYNLHVDCHTFGQQHYQTPGSVTTLPLPTGHMQSPSYFEYNRKKKDA